MIGGQRVLGIIPARGGSKGVPGKNIQVVGGRPLIGWTIEAARASACLDAFLVSTDDEAITAVARAEGADVPFRRAAELATDTATSVDVALDAGRRLPGFDILVLLQPTSPLRTGEDIDAALKLMLTSGAASCASVCEALEHPWLMFARDDQDRLQAFFEPPAGASLRRQDLPKAYVLNGAVYAARMDRLAETRRFFIPGETASYVMPIEKSDDIDTWDDLWRVDKIFQSTGRHRSKNILG